MFHGNLLILLLKINYYGPAVRRIMSEFEIPEILPLDSIVFDKVSFSAY